MARTSGTRRPKGRRRKSKAVPALVLMSLAGTACIAGYVILSRPAGAPETDEGMGLPAPDLAEIGRGGVAEIILKDKDDPTRVVAIISYDSQTPIGQGRYDTAMPRAWVYLDDGSYLHIRADEGRFYAPDEQRPQTGVMKGDVVLRVFDPAPERPADDAVAPVVIRVPQVSFDTEYGGIWSDAAGVATTPDLSFSFNDLRIVVNQVQERIELLEIRGGGTIAYTPTPVEPAPIEPAAPEVVGSLKPGQHALTSSLRPVSLSRAQPEGTPPPVAPPATGAPPSRRPAPDPVHYFAQFSREVRVSQGGVVATGDLLEVHARVIDNRIPEGPVATPDPRRGTEAQTSRPGAATIIRTALSATARAAERASSSSWPPMRRRPGTGPAPEGDPSPTPDSPPSPPLGEQGAAPSEPPTATPTDAALPARAMPAPAIESQEPITLDWAGPLTLRPLAAEPPELRREHLAARLTGGEGGGVSLSDETSGATGSCARLEYGFTTQSIVLAGVGDAGTRLSSAPAAGESEAGGTLRSGRTEYSVATGIGRVPGPGTLEGQGFQRIAWTRQMDFVLQSRAGQVLAEPEEVIFQGDVRGENEGTSFDAGFARATFTPPVDGAGARSTLSSVLLDEAVTLRGGQDERVSASRVRVEFDTPTPGQTTPSDRPSPTFFEADGGVVATRPGDRIEAQHVEATMAPAPRGRPEVQTLSASGGVALSSRPEALEVSGESMDVDLPALRLRVQGRPESLARVVRGPTAIRGVDVRLAGRPREARVVGLGEFAHETRATDPSPEGLGTLGGATPRDPGQRTTFDANWTQVMTFDDHTGQLRCVGDVVATMREGSSRVDRLSAWNIEASIDPAPASAAQAAESTPEPAPAVDGTATTITDPNAPAPSPIGATAFTPDQPALDQPADFDSTPVIDRTRRLRTMVATGSSADSADGERARVESRRYAPPAPDGSPVLQELLYLEGDRILYDNTVGTLDVPGPGKLMIVDRRTPEGERASEPGVLGGGSARGDGLFEWKGSLHIDRVSGEVTMLDSVTLIHRRASDGAITRLEAPRLTARAGADPDPAPGTATGLGTGRLRRVQADGGVWVQAGDQEVTAQVVDYDADAGILTAFTPGGTVRVSQGGSIRDAAAVRWDINAGRIEIIDPSGLVAPR